MKIFAIGLVSKKKKKKKEKSEIQENTRRNTGRQEQDFSLILLISKVFTLNKTS